MPEIDVHSFVEVGSPELLEIEIEIKYLSPVRKNGQLVGVLDINRARVLGSRKNA